MRLKSEVIVSVLGVTVRCSASTGLSYVACVVLRITRACEQGFFLLKYLTRCAFSTLNIVIFTVCYSDHLCVLVCMQSMVL